MKKIAVSIGLVAVGTASLQAAYTLGSDSMQSSKVWSLSGSLRGFYDDNYNTAPSGTPLKRGSYGFEVSPSISLNLPLDQTDIGVWTLFLSGSAESSSISKSGGPNPST
jgi:hypothetical protein